MAKKVILAGVLGGIVIILWTFVLNGIFGFRSSIDMKKVPNEAQVYAVLQENIAAPGRYVCNPQMPQDAPPPHGQPVFGIFYSGVGHEDAGQMMIFELLIFILAPTLAAWLLSQTSQQILTSYGRKVLFFVAIGLLFAFFSNLSDYGIAGYPLGDALLLGLHNICLWTVIGLVVAWKIKPGERAD
ncbi:MAG: hypothetical protein DWQ10_15995 [Calditrichaeota bacterium]|nr:MAG: hypothetical protein DWQ10_15995 [Calditrichota bacterium]